MEASTQKSREDEEEEVSHDLVKSISSSLIGYTIHQRHFLHQCPPPLFTSQDNPLHISLFPPHEDEELDISFILNSSLDIFDIRARAKTLDQDLGLLHAIDERLAAYGWLTNTGIKFIIIVDMMGRAVTDDDKRKIPQPVVGLRDAELKPAFRAVQTAYIRLLLNPFFTPEDRTPLQLANYEGRAAEIKSRKFVDELQRIGSAWYPGIQSI